MSLAIVRVGTAVPETVIDQTDALAIARALGCPTLEQDTWLPGMYAGTQIRTRRLGLSRAVVRDIIDGTKHTDSPFLPKGDHDDRGPTTAQRMEHYIEFAPPLALGACRDAVARSGVAPDEFTHLITVSCTGFYAPGIDRMLVSKLGLRPTIERTHVGYMGCHGALNGLRVAQAFAGQPGRRVLLCAVEVCGVHYHYSYNPAKMIANAIFGDGAAAVVGVSSGEAPAEAWRVLATGSCYIPNSETAMTWNVGDHGFEMTLGKNVPGLIHRHVRPWLESWLDEVGPGVAGIRTWGVHPGGPRIISAVEETLDLKPEQTRTSREVFGELGNMSSPTVLFILQRLIERDAPRPCVLLGFGPGLVAEAVLVG